MKLFLFAILAWVFLPGCDLPQNSALADVKDSTAEGVTNATVSLSPVVTELTHAEARLATATNGISPPRPPGGLDLPEAAVEVVTLAHKQISDGVLTNFIANLQEPFRLGADQIVYLRDVGVSPSVIEALLIKQQQLESASTERPTVALTKPLVSETETPPAPPPAATNLKQTEAPPVPYPGSLPSLQAPQVEPAVATGTPPEEPQPVVNDFNFFYDSLAPYGNWVTVPSYGYVWQPSCTVVTPGWRPYWNNGSWVWSDSGWYWNSSYSWGWAPFHYGNWFNSPGFGWCWAPGRVWGPSWVTFRYSSGFCGWAPLPPGCGWRSGVGLTWGGGGLGVSFGFGFSAANYCWTPTGYFSAANCANFGISGPQAIQVYNNSKVINNYIVGNNNTIINGGIDPGQIQQHSRTEIRKVQLADATAPAAAGRIGSTGRPGQANQLAVYRPAVTAEVRAPQTVVTRRSEVRPTQLAANSGSMVDRSRLLSRTPPLRGAQPSVSAGTGRVDLPAGSPNPLGGPVQLLNRPGASQASGRSDLPNRGSAATANPVTSPQQSTAVPSRSNPAANRTSPASRYTGQPSQGNPGTARLEPRKASPIDSRGGYSSAPDNLAPARLVPTQDSNLRPANSGQMPARTPPSARIQPVNRPQAAPGATGPTYRASTPPASSFNSAPRTVNSAPTMSTSRPQYSGGANSGNSLGRPGSRQAP